MTLQIVTADERAAEAVTVKALILGPSGVGKTTLLRTLDPSTTLFLDIEAGDLSVKDVPIAGTIRPGTWPEMRDLACWIGGPNAAFRAERPYSQAHYDAVSAKLGGADSLERFKLLFVDSITVASRTCLAWAETQPEAYSEKTGKPDMRGAYGLLGREFVAWLTQLQHARGMNVVLLAILDSVKDDFGRMNWEAQIAGAAIGRQMPGIIDQVVTMNFVDFGDGKPVRAFVTKTGNPWGFPAKDRSGRLDEVEPPHLGNLIAKASDQTRQRGAITSTMTTPPADATPAIEPTSTHESEN
jgi:hypothetical protein